MSIFKKERQLSLLAHPKNFTKKHKIPDKALTKIPSIKEELALDSALGKKKIL
jgi:hypothetical protein